MQKNKEKYFQQENSSYTKEQISFIFCTLLTTAYKFGEMLTGILMKHKLVQLNEILNAVYAFPYTAYEKL